MMNDSRRLLPIDDDLSDFMPRPKSAPTPVTAKEVDRVSSFPSREASDDDQINIKLPGALKKRFQAMAKAERYKYGAFLEILMDAYEKR